MLQWCSLHSLRIANTFGTIDEELLWTYRNGNSRKQLDYILVDTICHMLKPISCCVWDSLDTGSDHRALIASFECKQVKPRKRKTQKKALRMSTELFVGALDAALLAEHAPAGDLTERVAFIHKAIQSARNASMICSSNRHAQSESTYWDNKVTSLIADRRALKSNPSLTAADFKAKRIALSKSIQAALRKKLQEEKSVKLDAILKDFRGLHRITNILAPIQSKKIVQIRNDRDELCSDPDDISEVFALFYEKLYSTTLANDATSSAFVGRLQHKLPPFTMAELKKALRHLKCGKARDQFGITAELLKAGSEVLQQLLLELFNEVISLEKKPPEQWRATRLIVIFKKGDASLPSNYRPISLLPILYKLFSCMLCNRVQATIIGEQSADQAAYRPGFSTEDHLLAVTLLWESAKEWNIDLWLAVVDFEKAFDTVEHSALWISLSELGVDHRYIRILQILYDCQIGSVIIGTESRAFDLQRGVKQGDPISSLLFLAVMESIFRILKSRWNHLNTARKTSYYGIVVDDPADPLTNLRFADDVLLFAGSRHDAVKMVRDLAKVAHKYGLKIHRGKTVILTTADNRPPHVRCDDLVVKVAPVDHAEKYLGRKLCMAEYHECELANRIAAAWAAFMKFKEVLCNRRVKLRDRLRMFNAVITSSVLYGCSSWTLVGDECRKLLCTQRRMLRWMIRPRRMVEEPWVDYIRRATWHCECLAREHGVHSWVQTYRLRKWKFAGKTANALDRRWSFRLLGWRPWFRCTPHRRVGRPCKRWGDEIVALAGSDWKETARDTHLWALTAPGYADKVS